MPEGRANTMSTASRKSRRPPATRKAGRVMPSASSSGAPTKAKARMRMPATSVPRQAMCRRNRSGAPRISAAKIAALPTGSTMTKSATPPWRICSSIAFPPPRLRAPLQDHPHAVARAQGDEALRLDGKSGLEAEAVALRDGRQQQHRLGHGESGADADALAGAEGDIGETMARPRALRREALGIELARPVPELGVAVEQPGHDQNLCARGNEAAQHLVIVEGGARQGVCRRVQPHRFLEHHARIAQLAEVLVSRRTAAQHRGELGME